MDDTPLKDVNIETKEFEGDAELQKRKTIRIVIIVVSLVVIAAIIATVVVLTKPKEEPKPNPRSLLEKIKSKETPYYYYNTTLLNATIEEALRIANPNNIKLHFSLKSNFNKKL